MLVTQNELVTVLHVGDGFDQIERQHPKYVNKMSPTLSRLSKNLLSELQVIYIDSFLDLCSRFFQSWNAIFQCWQILFCDFVELFWMALRCARNKII